MRHSAYQLLRIPLLNLSEKVSEQPSEGGSGRYEGPKWGENDLLGGLSGSATSACKAFRTVSLRRWVNTGQESGLSVATLA
jgi:hypothetical protein